MKAVRVQFIICRPISSFIVVVSEKITKQIKSQCQYPRPSRPLASGRPEVIVDRAGGRRRSRDVLLDHDHHLGPVSVPLDHDHHLQQANVLLDHGHHLRPAGAPLGHDQPEEEVQVAAE